VTYGLFEVTGIELEYMIVDRETLAPRPIADLLLGSDGELSMGPIACSNELVMHVLELKTNGPVPALAGVAEQFQASVRELNARLEPHGAMLLPGGMHPFMDPYTETRLWPHAQNEIYAAFDRIFDCRGHGWSNVQSAHINLPFRDDSEFGRLHAAVRALLPLLPALSASSPIADGKPTGFMDTRLEHYAANAARVPSVSGEVVPEALADGTRAEYEREILGRIYRDLTPHDPDGVLRHEWVNARGAIARFDRNAIEIRVLDVSECPAADLAIAEAVIAAAKALCDERLSSYADQRRLPLAPLAELLRDVIRGGERAIVRDAGLLAVLGFPSHASDEPTAKDVWEHLIETTLGDGPAQLLTRARLDVILREGPLARRILAAAAASTPQATYARLAVSLAEGRAFRALTMV
jgi:gamma-glutamyl:cysteine ligase YbdK (ATP-grasp superfamily)